MKEVKYHLGRSRVYEVSLKNFKEVTQEKRKVNVTVPLQ